MERTNKYHLPEPLVSAILHDTYDYSKAGHISVTGLIQAPRQYQLVRRHDKEIEEDVSEGLWRFLGNCAHQAIERADTSDHLVEERLSIQVNNWTVTGKPDLLGSSQPLQLSDWKITSVYSFLLGEKPEWTAQIQLYAVLYRKHGFRPVSAHIWAILRDHMASKALQDKDYPQIPFMNVEIPLWPKGKQETYLVERVKLHQEAEHLDDDALPDCTAEERWERPTTYAVIKKGNKRARRVFNDAHEATVEVKPGEDIVKRPGASVRCERFCKAAEFCSQKKVIDNAKNGSDS